MKYGEFLAANSIPGWKAHYLKYDFLKGPLDSGIFIEERQFVSAIIKEQERLDLFISGKVVEVINMLRFLEDTDDLTVADETSENLQKLDIFLRHNLEGFRKLIKKYVKKTGFSSAWYEHGRDERWLAKASRIMSELIVHLSLFYKRRLDGGKEKMWDPPSSFSRNTVKYWVAPEHWVPVKLLLLKHLPILELIPSAKIDLEFHKQQVNQTQSFISSVYFDNDEFFSYHTRIRQEEGAQLFRIRWYGGLLPSPMSTLTVPDPTQLVYVERKTHHESWVGEESAKERFPLLLSLVAKFLSGQVTPEQAFELMELQGMLGKGEGAKHLALATDSQAAFLARGLHPVLRTSYKRTAFQRSDSNQVRISFDTPCYFVPEANHADFWANLDYKGDVEPFEYGVLEVKTVGDKPPPFVDELLATGFLIRVDKFSKFQTTIATHYFDHIQIMPHWMEPPTDQHAGKAVPGTPRNSTDFYPIDARLVLEAAEAARLKALEDTDDVAFVGNVQTVIKAATLDEEDEGKGDGAGIKISDEDDNDVALPDNPVDFDAPTSPRVAAHDDDDENGLFGFGAGRDADRKSDGDKSKVAETMFRHEEALGAWWQPAPDTAPEAVQLRQRKLSSTGTAVSHERPKSVAASVHGGSQKRTLLAIPEHRKSPASNSPALVLKKNNLQRTKIEPKTYFANERTFLQWVSAAILLITLSTAVMSLNPTARLTGTVVSGVALVFIFYALGIYQWRLHKIIARDGTRLDDRFGPYFISIMLVIAIVVVLTIIWSQDMTSSTATTTTSGSSLFSSQVTGTAASTTFSTASTAFMADTLAREARGCLPLGVVSDFAPTSYVLHESIADVMSVATYSDLDSFLALFSAKLAIVAGSKSATVAAISDTVLCAAPWNCDSDAATVRLNTVANSVLLSFTNVSTDFVPPIVPATTAGGRANTAGYFVRGDCNTAGLASWEATLALDATTATPATLTNTTAALNSLLASTYFPEDTVTADTTRFFTRYTFALGQLGLGVTATMFLDVFYASADDLAYLRNGTAAEWSLQLDGAVTQSAVRRAEGIMEALTVLRSASFPAEAIIAITCAIFFLVVALVLVGLGCNGALHCRKSYIAESKKAVPVVPVMPVMPSQSKPMESDTDLRTRRESFLPANMGGRRDSSAGIPGNIARRPTIVSPSQINVPPLGSAPRFWWNVADSTSASVAP